MAKNKLINNIDLDLASAEIKDLISDIKLSIAFVVDVNHDGDTSNNLNIGEVLAKKLSMVGTSELTDNVYKPINANINEYPLAGEFVLVIESSFGRYYISSINLFNNKSNNIDIKNINGYVNFSDDENINNRIIKSDKKTQKSVLENNKKPFNKSSFNKNQTYNSRFGEISFVGRFGNKISLTNSDEELPELLLLNDKSSIELKNGKHSYNLKSSNSNINPKVNNNITHEYDGQQILGNSDRLFFTIGDKGIYQETSGLISFISDDDVFFNSKSNINIEGELVYIGSQAQNKSVLGNNFMKDFKQLLDSMTRFANNLKKQDKLISLSNAANNFLTDLEQLGWNNFNEDDYLSSKVYVE